MRTIQAKEVQDAINTKSDIVILNVLPSSIFAEEHIPGSMNIPLEDSDFVEQVKMKLQDVHRPVIVYCASLLCPASTEAATILEEEGFSNVMDFKGGMEEWHKIGQKIESGAV